MAIGLMISNNSVLNILSCFPFGVYPPMDSKYAQLSVPNSVGTKVLASRVGICIIIATALMGSGLPSPLYVLYQASYHLSNTWVNVLFSMYAVGVLVALMLIVSFGDKIADRRILIVSSSILILLSSIIMIFASSQSELLVGRLLTGLGTGSVLGSASAALLELDRHNNEKTTAILTTITFTLGSGLGPCVSGFLINAHWYPTITSYCVIMMLAFIALPLICLTPLPVQNSSVETTDSHSHKINPLSNRGFWVASITVIAGWSVGAVFMSSGQLFTTHLAMVTNPFIAALLITLFQFAAGIGQVSSGLIEQKKAIAYGLSLCVAGQIGMYFCAISAFTLGYQISSLLSGLGYGVSFVGATGLINREAPPSQRASFISSYYVLAYIFGNAIPSLSVGTMIDHFDLAIAMRNFTCAVFLVLILVLSLLKGLKKSPIHTLVQKNNSTSHS